MKRRYLESRVEWEYIEQLIDAIDNPNTKNQVRNALEWYVIKASRYRGIEHFLNGVTLVVPAVLVVLNQYMPEKCITVQLVTAISGIFAASAKSFSKLHDKRICYRRAAEEIKSETVLYIHRVGNYNADKRNTIFVSRINEIRKNENNSWADIESDNGAVKRENSIETVKNEKQMSVSKNRENYR